MGENYEPLKMPKAYRQPASKQGQIVVLEYEAFGFDKCASIYLPYGYDGSCEGIEAEEGSCEGVEAEDRGCDCGSCEGVEAEEGSCEGVGAEGCSCEGEIRYPSVYLQHGRGGSYRTWLGTAEKPRPFKNILDNMIENEDIPPCIVICPELTYGYGSDEEIMEGMSRELAEVLIPLVDSKFRTIPERAKRAMSGFSMGGSLTWHMLKDHSELFKFYAPMSMALYYSRKGLDRSLSMQAAASIAAGLASRGYTNSDISIFASSGELDHKKSALIYQVRDFVNLSGILDYELHIWPKRRHTFKHSYPYLYNALIKFLN